MRGGAFVRRALSAAPLLAVLGCGRLLGPPPRPKTDGYQAVVTVTSGGKAETFSIAVRGEALRRSLGEGEKAPYLLRTSAAGPVLEVDPSARTAKPADGARLLAGLTEFPLAPGFSHVAEAARRGLTAYHRESDGIYLGMACQVWRFDDGPDDPASPSTSIWVATALDDLAVRYVREVSGPNGKAPETTVELTRIRAGADESLFVPPAR